MPDIIQLKRGAQGAYGAMEGLAEGEAGYITDKKELHVGTSAGNVLVGSEKSAKGIFPKVKLEAQTALASVANGTIFEDTDGQLKYKNLAGVVMVLAFDASTIESDIDALQSDVTTLQSNVTTLQGSMTTAQGNINTLQSGKQDKNDAALNTTSKTIVGAINELEALI